MGAGPPLPLPTDPSSLNTPAGTSAVATDLATEVSRRTDRTSFSIPEDGSPITISTRAKKQDREKEREGKLARSHPSQTSLLIEYFEGGKGRSSVQSRPSVRVKVTPSAARKIKDANEHIQISESGRSRQPSYTRRISLAPNARGDAQTTDSVDERSVSSFASATEESLLDSRQPPVEIEVLRDAGTPVSATSSARDLRYMKPNPSEISSMPPDSMLEGNDGVRTPRRRRSRSLGREDVEMTSQNLKTPARRRSRSLSRERITQKVIEKLGGKPVEPGSRHKRRSHDRSRSVSKEHIEPVRSGRRRSSKTHREEDLPGGPESSTLTVSQVSHRSGDQQSIRSGTSKSSINNPRLLETVEDAIRRLILPELTALKHEQKTQGNRAKFEERARDSVASVGSGTSREESRRRVAKTSSAPDVGKPKVMLNQDEHGRGIVLSGDSVKGRKHRKSSRELTDSPSGRSYDRKASSETVTDGKVRSKKSKDRAALEEAAAAGAAKALTAAALSHHDSRSSIDRRERRKRRSKSRSRSASLADDIPPMPLSSEVNASDVTRDSILTAQTERPGSAASRERQTPVRELASPGLQTPPRSSNVLQRKLGTHHTNISRGDISVRGAKSQESIQSGNFVTRAIEAGLAAVAASESSSAGGAAVGGGDEGHEHDHHLRHRRSLSPIQSEASYRESSAIEPENRQSFLQTRSTDSLSSADQDYHRKGSAVSIGSVSSSPSTKVARAKRTAGAGHVARDSTVTQDTAMESDYMNNAQTPRDAESGYWGDRGENNSPSKDPTVDANRMTDYTDDSLDGTYLEKIAAGQQVLGVGANPQYRHTPVAVESAVASLHNPSFVDVHSTRSGFSKGAERSYPNSLEGGRSRQSSPTKRSHGVDEPSSATQKTFHQRLIEKTQNGEYHPEDGEIMVGTSGLPDADSPMPEIGHGFEDESEINTNPSIIQGPIGGVAQGNRDHWPYEPTPPQSNGQFLDGHTTPDERQRPKTAEARHHDLGLEFRDEGEVREGYAKDDGPRDGYTNGVHEYDSLHDTYPNENTVHHTPIKDEGYISAAPNPRSPGTATPDMKIGRLNEFGADDMGPDDPFFTSNNRRVSGNSHGMPSPLYDSATGNGIDRIQSQDIVALMDHLTVRDAQRNARDTEILVTLVRSAAEMRNSFEDMKRLLAEQENHIITSTDKNTERAVQKVINGPRPQPFGTPRTRRTSADDDMIEDLPAKRRNVFRRALKGLSMRSSNDLAKIEDMLVQLLGDVEGLKAAQEPRPSMTQQTSFNSYDNLRTVPEGYEPEGQAGTGSTNQSASGSFTNLQPRQVPAMSRPQDHRISTVPEADEELSAREEDAANHYADASQYLSPAQNRVRGTSVPLDSPPQVPVPAAAYSNENTPRTDKSKKHKSTSSSIFPKISRWSETTASTVAKQFRGSGRKDKEYSEGPSRSGSEIDYWHDQPHETQEGDRFRSSYSLDRTPTGHEDRPPSPLIPQSAHEDPRYQAHRDSLNLQHPQPRQGPTPRYQNQLESQAQNFASPVSPYSDQWTSNPNLAHFSTGTGNRSSGGAGHLSPISDGGYSNVSAGDRAGPPRPPKVPDEPLVPQRPPKLSMKDNKPQYASPLASGYQTAGTADEHRYSNRSGSTTPQMNGSPRSLSNNKAIQRKPTGPRPISSHQRKDSDGSLHRRGISQPQPSSNGW